MLIFTFFFTALRPLGSFLALQLLDFLALSSGEMVAPGASPLLPLIPDTPALQDRATLAENLCEPTQVIFARRQFAIGAKSRKCGIAFTAATVGRQDSLPRLSELLFIAANHRGLTVPSR